MTEDVYSRKPISFRGTIPVFSAQNEYTENYERIAADHLTSLRQNGTNPFIPENLWVQSENATAEIVSKYANPGDMILDVGVGLGRLLSRFLELRRYGMDISFGYLDEAQAKGIEVCYALIEDMPYREQSFDIVVCTDVLEHVIDLNLSCRKILQTLKPGGFLIARTPYREDLSRYASADCPYKYVHLRTFDVSIMRLLFERVFDCEVIETVVNGYLPLPSRLKCPFPFPKRDAILSRLLSALQSISPSSYDMILRKWYNPIELNAVVKK